MNISKIINNCCCFCTAPERNGPKATSAGVLKGLELISKLLDIPLEKKSELYSICKDCGECLRQINEFQLEIQVLQLKTEDKIKDIQIAILENRSNGTTGSSSRQSSNAAADSRLAALFVDKCKNLRKNPAVSLTAISHNLSAPETAGVYIATGNRNFRNRKQKMPVSFKSEINGSVGEGDSRDAPDAVGNGEQDQVESTWDSPQGAFTFLEVDPEADDYEGITGYGVHETQGSNNAPDQDQTGTEEDGLQEEHEMDDDYEEDDDSRDSDYQNESRTSRTSRAKGKGMKPKVQGSQNSANGFKCSHCDQNFDSKRAFDFHLRIKHRSKTNGLIKCTICEKVFKRRDYLQDHIRTVHDQIERYACPNCEEKFKYRLSLRKHLAANHAVA